MRTATPVGPLGCQGCASSAHAVDAISRWTHGNPPVKITYSTMSGDQLEGLHRALDAEIPKVQAKFGQTHPLWINGRTIKTVESLDRKSVV